MRKYIDIINETNQAAAPAVSKLLQPYLDKIIEEEANPLAEAFDDFKDPALEKPDNGDEKVESDFDMFKDEGEAGAPDTASDVSEPKGDIDEVAAALNAKDPEVFSSGYKKLCAGAIDSIDVTEAKELADTMLALLKKRIEDGPIEESNQDIKMANDAAAKGEPAPQNPNAPKAPLTPNDARAQQAAATNNQSGQQTQPNAQQGQPNAQAPANSTAAPTNANAAPTPNKAASEPEDDEEATEEAADIVRKAGIPVKRNK